MEPLFQSQCFPYLEFLILKQNLIRGLPLKEQNLKSLKFIDLRDNKITDRRFLWNSYFKSKVVLAYESKPKTKKTTEQDLNTIWEMSKNSEIPQFKKFSPLHVILPTDEQL